MWLEKWNGVLPIFMAGDDQGVMINMGDLQTMVPAPAVTTTTDAQEQNAQVQTQLHSLIDMLDEVGVVVTFDENGNVILNILED